MNTDPTMQTSRRSPWIMAGVGGLAVMLAACATVPPPTEQMAVSQAAVEHASGPATAAAPEALAAARDKLAWAEQAMANKDYGLARQLAEQAEADAAFAEAQARANQSGDALAKIRQRIRELRARLNNS